MSRYKFCQLCGEVHQVLAECGPNRPKTPRETGEAKLRAWSNGKHIQLGKEPILTEEEMAAATQRKELR